MENNSIIKNIFLLWKIAGYRRKAVFSLLLILMVVAAAAELLTVITVMPFIASITSQEIIQNYKIFQFTSERFNLSGDPTYITAGIFISFILLSAVIRLLTLYSNIFFSVSFGIFLSNKTYEKTLNQKYLSFISSNSSETISAIIDKVDAIVFHFIQGVLNLATSLFLLIAILTALIIVDFQIALIAGSAILSLYLVVSLLINPYLKRSSKIIAFQQSNLIKVLNEGLNSIRDIILSNKQSYYLEEFSKHNISLRKILGYQSLLSNAPRYLIEALLLGFAVLLVVYIFNIDKDSFLNYLPVIGAMVLGAQRLIPNVQLIYQTWLKMKGNNDSCSDVINILMDKSDEADEKLGKINIDFNKSITFDNVNYAYADGQPLVLENVNIEIEKGTLVGIFGATGSGKSTFIDLLMGMLNPKSGRILIDGTELTTKNILSWQNKISHVPQSIYLSDETFSSNVAFGIEKANIDSNKLSKSIEIADAKNFIELKEDGINSIVGEKGIKISGGQRQRIGIARSIYRNFEILVLDEATNALDEETEKKVISSILKNNNNATIIMLTHRTSSLKNCDKILQVMNKTIYQVKKSNV